MKITNYRNMYRSIIGFIGFVLFIYIKNKEFISDYKIFTVLVIFYFMIVGYVGEKLFIKYSKKQTKNK